MKRNTTVREWIKPIGRTYNFHENALAEPHLLIAGATGSGKSVIINGLIYTALYRRPGYNAGMVKFIFIDPKKVALAKYRDLPHVLCYADTHETAIEAIRYGERIMDDRLKQCQLADVEDWMGGDLYIIIDELMDLMTTKTTGKHFAPTLQRIAQLGRSAKVHVIAATQCPLREVIPTPIRCNFDARIGLRTRSAQDSKNILDLSKTEFCEKLGFDGLHCLPIYGECVYMHPAKKDENQPDSKRGKEIEYLVVPMIPRDEINRLVTHWMNQTKPARRGLFRRH